MIDLGTQLLTWEDIVYRMPCWRSLRSRDLLLVTEFRSGFPSVILDSSRRAYGHLGATVHLGVHLVVISHLGVHLDFPL